ncbi:MULTISPECIES: GntR family transcriptional regulator [Halomonas]|uniref:GntR family transcriptional regulator n=1 Tax=Halomonas TaxID=2745 RepID=UPI001C94BA07|nr:MULTISPECIES: FCD domain-containing protein [Halomonas]MBY5925728.1 FCD domain-containing protein [Halomonas sp. DP4Y7-2]MBY6030550.1 FCD domain-containing protein [Halomonas sp. DP8Y7-1]MBY6207909.1 FCD domain-containing protein [Halomonas sp. DP3Y7-2]MBY6228718.1 FCD domain-containing protein [Halomonas sp. DP3Y7-1]MBY6232453.1 FCD domain-containing protein [Halomonas sp. DP4Y7-1]
MTTSQPAEAATSGETAASQVFHALKVDLIRGRFAAGEKLAISALKDRYEVGLSPLREALNRLAAYGLLEQHNQRGFRVPPLSADELEDIARLRVQLECMALTQAFQAGDAEWESQLLAASHRLTRANKVQGEVEQWEQAHQRFHRTLLAPCGSHWLLRFIEQLHDQFDRYRRLAPGNPEIRERLDAQHGELVTLALERRIHDARHLLEDHIRQSWEVAKGACAAR